MTTVPRTNVVVVGRAPRSPARDGRRPQPIGNNAIVVGIRPRETRAPVVARAGSRNAPPGRQSHSPAAKQTKTKAVVDEDSSARPLAVATSTTAAGYDSNVETYRKPPRWLKNLDSEEDEARVLNYAINLALVGGTGILFGYKFFAIDADLWRGWTLTEILSAAFRDNWSFYESSLASHPVVSKAFISGLVYGLGDLTAQTYEGKSIGSLDRGRMIRSSLTGLIAHGPCSHVWYIVADDLCAPLGDGLVAAGTKLLLDQTVWAFIWLSIYYGVLGALNFDSPSKIVKTFKASFLPVCLVGWRFWPFVHIVTYGLIPQQHRLLWVDVMEIIWVTILSYVGNQKRKEALEVSQEAVEDGTEDVGPVAVIGQVSCALPTAVSGGNPAEEIARSMEIERQVCIEAEDICAPADLLFSKEEAFPKEEGKEDPPSSSSSSSSSSSL